MTEQFPREDEHTTGEEHQPDQESSEQTEQSQNRAEDEQRYTTSGVLHRITRWLRGR